MAGFARRFCLLGGAAISLFSTAHAFYLPGAAPHDYHEGEKVDLFVNALTPMVAGSDNAKLVRHAPLIERLKIAHATLPHQEIPHKLYACRPCQDAYVLM